MSNKFLLVYTKTNGNIGSVESTVSEFSTMAEARNFFEAQVKETVRGILDNELLDTAIALKGNKCTIRIEGTLYVIAVVEPTSIS